MTQNLLVDVTSTSVKVVRDPEGCIDSKDEIDLLNAYRPIRR